MKRPFDAPHARYIALKLTAMTFGDIARWNQPMPMFKGWRKARQAQIRAALGELAAEIMADVAALKVELGDVE